MEQYFLEVSSLDRSYDGVRILHQINLSLNKGDFVGLIGPNGSGKTTLLKSIGRVLKPEGGTILLSGQDIYRVTQKRVARKMATVPQETLVTFDFTVRDVVLMGRTPHLKRLMGESPHDFEVVEQAMRYAQISHLSERSITELSGGEKQKVIIAQALAQEPQLLLLDEPTTHLDIHHQLEILDLIKGLSRQGLAVISVFHDLNLAAQYCDFLVLLSDGRIRVTGTPEEVLTTEKIRESYGVEVVVGRNEVTGKLSITAYSHALTHERKGDKGHGT